ncbi:serine hydrolase [Streptomyces sp. NPDC048338]|uniref:D-alanyl-D-alanine carboxypeptidase n=1 Tax=Streptomyces sp. NPDC048338 TaxID=3365536 RepID=UPI003715B053
MTTVAVTGGDAETPEPEKESAAATAADSGGAPASDDRTAEEAPARENAEALEPEASAEPAGSPEDGDSAEPEAAAETGDASAAPDATEEDDADARTAADEPSGPTSQTEDERETPDGTVPEAPAEDPSSESPAAESAAGASEEAADDAPDAKTEAAVAVPDRRGPDAAAPDGEPSEPVPDEEAPAAAADEGTSTSGPDEEPGTTVLGTGPATTALDELPPIDGRDEEPRTAEPAEPGPVGPRRPTPSWARSETDAQSTRTLAAPQDLDTPTANFATAATPPAASRVSAQPVAPGAPASTESPAPAGAPAAPADPAAAPLDLLAQLTNTPPPAETLRRTSVRRLKVWTPLLLLLAGAVIGAQMLRPLPEPRLVASEQTHTVEGRLDIPWPAKGQGAVRIAGSGTISTFGVQKPVPTASVAKVMTAYVVLKDHPLRKGEAGPTITIDSKAVAEGASANESRIEGLTEGSTYSQLDMLKMLMIPSGNNAARLLARWDTGSDSEAAFVEKMNAGARELGMTDTRYTDPSGLDAGTVSTAVDQLKLAEAVMKNDVFRSVVSLPDAEIKDLSQRLINNNTLLNAHELSIRGIKTGSSTPAGGALMWAGYKSVGDETPLILGTLMDQHADGPDPNATRSLALVLANSRKVIESVRGALTAEPVVRRGRTVGHVDDGLGGRTPLVATADLNVVATPGQRLRLVLGAAAKGGSDAPIPHTATAGTQVGVLTVGEGAGARSVPVALGENLAEPSFGTRLTRLG